MVFVIYVSAVAAADGAAVDVAAVAVEVSM
jgi:hypothetical protein